MIYWEFTRPREMDPYLPFTTKPEPLVLTKGLELLPASVRDGVLVAAAEAKRVLKNKDTQERRFMMGPASTKAIR